MAEQPSKDAPSAYVVASVPAIVETVLPVGTSLPAAEAKAILQTAFLAAEIDLDEDPAEGTLLDAVRTEIWRRAELAPRPQPLVSPLPLPIDREARSAVIRELANQLGTPAARELAYVVAHLLTIADLEITGAEDSFVGELRSALRLDPRRAADLVTTALEIMTPGVEVERT